MKIIIGKFLRDLPAVLGLGIVIFGLFVALFATELAPRPEAAFQSDLLMRFKPPSAEFWFGTDNLGRDIFSRVILGTRSAFMIALVVVLSAMLAGVPLGLAAGYLGGWRSEAIMRVTDVVLAVPQLILALALAQLMKPGLWTAMLALSLTYWPFFTRTVYAETRRLKASLFVEALQGIGASTPRILFCISCPMPRRRS